MANKHQVLELLAEGLTPKEIANRLGCNPAYVRATRRRATDEGARIARQFASRRRTNKKRCEKMKSSAEYREGSNAYMRKWRRGVKASYPSVNC